MISDPSKDVHGFLPDYKNTSKRVNDQSIKGDALSLSPSSRTCISEGHVSKHRRSSGAALGPGYSLEDVSGERVLGIFLQVRGNTSLIGPDIRTNFIHKSQQIILPSHPGNNISPVRKREPLVSDHLFNEAKTMI